VKRSKFDELAAHALTVVPERGETFFLVVYDDEMVADGEFAQDAYAFKIKAKALACAKALANGNMSRKVIRCTVEARIPSTDEQLVGRKRGRPSTYARRR
jgi:hypothetical protein